MFSFLFLPIDGMQPIPDDKDNPLGGAKDWALAHRGDLRTVLRNAPAFYKQLGFGLVSLKKFDPDQKILYRP